VLPVAAICVGRSEFEKQICHHGLHDTRAGRAADEHEILLDYNNQANANELSASHIAAQSPNDNSAAMTNIVRAFVDRNAQQADRSDCEAPS
jgi:predicted transcriptional regulator